VGVADREADDLKEHSFGQQQPADRIAWSSRGDGGTDHRIGQGSGEKQDIGGAQVRATCRGAQGTQQDAKGEKRQRDRG
jgi:hypothetical protein